MKFLKIALFAIALLAFAGCATAQVTGIPPRGVAIATLGENQTVYVGALVHSPRQLISAKWIRIQSDEAISIVFNGGPVLYQESDEDVVSGVGNATYSVGEEVPIASGEWHLFSCSSTELTLIDCDGGSATIIAEY